jgi:Lrp/AsnC family leucine-responsive transcriptional regulator
MDKKDKRILKELDRNARQSNAQLAKKVSLSKDTVGYRIKKLEEKNVIQEYYSIIDYYKLGFYITKILIKFTNIGEKGEEKIARWLNKKSEVLWIAKTEGYWDLIYTLQIKNMRELLFTLESFKTTFPTATTEFQILIAQDFTFLNEKYLYEKNDTNKFEEISIDINQIRTDKRDEEIIKKLEENSRIPLIEIAEKLKLTPEAILQRKRKLEKNGIIKRYKVRLNFEKLDLDYNHIYLSIKNYAKIKEIEEYYKKSDYCTFIMKYQGNYHLHLEWVTKRGELRNKIKEFKEKFGNYIAQYHVVNIFEEYKIL